MPVRLRAPSFPCAFTLVAALALGACAGDAPTGSRAAAPPGAPAADGKPAPTASLAVTEGIGTGGTAFTGGPVYFDGSGSTPGTGTIESYGWDGDGDGTVDLVRSTPALARRFFAPGTYTVGLTVMDGAGDQATATTQVTVAQNHAPTAVIANGSPITVAEGALIAFSSAGSSDPDAGQALAYRWDLGDGTTSALASRGKRYADQGTYTATLTMTDASGATSVDSATVQVSNAAPTALLHIPARVFEGSAYTLSLGSIADAGSADVATLQYAFDCGDGAGFGSFGAAASTSCTRTEDQAMRTVGARIRDKDGGQNEYTRTLYIDNAAPQPSLIMTSSHTTFPGGSVDVVGSFTDEGGNDGPFPYKYVWGDGKTDGGTAVAPGPLPSGAHVFTTAGTYQVRLRVTDKDGTHGVSVVIPVTVQ
jgi:PKD repeat protein